jgi:WD40 repeat protein
MEKAHGRIIWDVSVSPLEFGPVFVTGSRDKCIKIWGGKEWNVLSTIKFSEAVTCCSFLHELVYEMVFLAIGLENGDMCILGYKTGEDDWKVVHTFDETYVLFVDD